MLKQVTVFLQNEPGRLAALCRALGDAEVNMISLTVADTESFGVVRILADAPEKAVDALVAEGYRAKLTEVSAVEIPNVPGSLAALLEALDTEGFNIEYAYCFASAKEAVVVVLRVEDASDISQIVEKLGCRCISPEDIQ